jgi:hypothetical protein
VRENVGLHDLRLLETASHATDRPGNSLLLGLAKDVLGWHAKHRKAGSRGVRVKSRAGRNAALEFTAGALIPGLRAG